MSTAGDGAALFREGAVRSSTEPVFATVSLATPVSFTLLTTAAVVAAAALIAFLLLGRYTQKETVRGYLATAAADVRVFPPAAGTVQTVFVRDGDEVAAGTDLFSITTGRSRGVADDTGRALVAAIEAEAAAVSRQVEQQRAWFADEARRIGASIDNAARQLEALRREEALSRSKSQISRRQRDGAARLRLQGNLSQAGFDRYQATHLEAELALAAFAARRGRLEADADDARQRLQQLQHLENTRLAELDAAQSRLAGRLAEARAGLSQVVRAPVAGRVSALNVRVGQTVSMQLPALVVLPLHATYHAELLVPGRSIGFVRSGTGVNLRFDAYPYAKFGVYAATIEEVSRAILLPGELALPAPVAEPVYRVRAALEQQHVIAYGEPIPLTAGLTLEADILRDERSLIEWMLDPLLGAGRRL